MSDIPSVQLILDLLNKRQIISSKKAVVNHTIRTIQI